MHAGRLERLGMLAGMHALTTRAITHDSTTFETIPNDSARTWSWRQLQQPMVSMTPSQLHRYQLPLPHSAAWHTTSHPHHSRSVQAESLRLTSITKATKKALPQMELWPCHCMGRPCQVPANTTLFDSVRCTTTQGGGGELTWCSRSIRP